MQTPGKHQVHETLLRIDPRFRDKTLFPKTNEYRVDFGKTMKNVVGICVHDARFPITEPVITEATNTVTYIIGTQTIQKTITPGTYTESTLVDALNAVMGSDITVTIDPVTKRLLFSSQDGSTPFRFDISSTSMSRILGFVTTSGFTQFVVTYSPQGPLDLTGCSYLVIRSNDVKTPGTGLHTDPGLAVVDVDRSDSYTKPMHREYPTIYFDTIREKMTGIHIRIERDDGTLYDTAYTNHYIILRICTLNERLIQMH